MVKIKRKELRTFINRSFCIASEHGFHDETRSDAHYLMLVLSEVGEMVEADRKNRRAARNKMEQVMSLDAAAKNSFDHYFELYVKDTLEDELADVCIRLFDWCGARDIEPWTIGGETVDMTKEFKDIFGNMTVCEQCFWLSCMVTNLRDVWDDDDRLSQEISSLLSFCFEFAHFHGIPLRWHIRQKMRYNANREQRHGKGY